MVVAASWAMNVTRFPVSKAVCMGCIWCMRMSLRVPIVLPATHRVSAFGLETHLRLGHVQVHGAQHVGQLRVGFDLEVVGLQFKLNAAFAQMVGRTHQVEGRAMHTARGDDEHVFRCGFHTDHAAVLRHQHITTAQHRGLGQLHIKRATLAVHDIEMLGLAKVPTQLNSGCTFEQHGRQALALREELVDDQHGVRFECLRGMSGR